MAAMRVLFVSNYFPPEVNAPAARLYEHARQWVADGHDVDVMTSVPNFPEGRVYDGYRNRYAEEEVDGIPVIRVPMYVAENRGTIKRTLSYLSFMLSCLVFSLRLPRRPDLVVATSPQFFAAIGGYLIARLRRIPFILEVRDLWPESIVAVGAVRRNVVIRLFERVERYLYRHSDHVVVVTNAFKRHVVDKGAPEERVTVLKNGFDLARLKEPLHDAVADLRAKLGLEKKFVASYIGTIGMAHGVEVMLEAAQKCEDPDIVFMIVGAGAERAKLEEMQARLQLDNVRLVDKQPRERIPAFLALSDVSVIHLKASPLFRTVIPSKIFEAMALRRPMVIGVEGESRELVVEAGAGVPMRPEDAGGLVNAVLSLKGDERLQERMANSGLEYVNRYHDRRKLARSYWSVMEDVYGRHGVFGARSAETALLDAA